MGYFGLEGTFKGHLVQTPCSQEGHLYLDQVAYSPRTPWNGPRDGASTTSHVSVSPPSL